MRKRLTALLRNAVPLLLAGAVLLFLAALGIGVPCPIYAVTGFFCPGCGVSRMLLALLRLDVAAAFRYNPAVFLALPLLALVLLSVSLRYVRSGVWKLRPLETALLWVLVAILLVFGVLRNLPAFPGLRPPGI